MQYAQQGLVRQFVDWKRVKAALAQYPNIGSVFTVQELQKGAEAPYYCHYLAWRLSGWSGSTMGAKCLQLLDELIGAAGRMDGWNNRKLTDNKRYDQYWSHLWELQVADALQRHRAIQKVEWLASGPDLKLRVNGQPCFVECTVYTKSFAAEHYIRDMLGEKCPDLDVHVEHKTSVYLSIPDTPEFLHELLAPFLCDEYVQQLRREARERGRADVAVPQTARNLTIWLGHPRVLAPPDPDNAHGVGACFEGESFVDDAVEKVLGNKRDRNALSCNRPNALFVNFLLAVDYPCDLDITVKRFGGLPDRQFVTSPNEPIDALFFFYWGIDRKLSLSSCHPSFRDPSRHPLADLLR